MPAHPTVENTPAANSGAEATGKGPIKRHPALVPFSREHHFGLLLVWKIRQGLRKETDPKRISEYALYFFENDLKLHFAREEFMLFSLLPMQDALCDRAFREHNRLYELIGSIAQDKQNAALLSAFAGELENHIRFEERVLFAHLQKNLGSRFDAAHAEEKNNSADPDLNWHDRFWETWK